MNTNIEKAMLLAIKNGFEPIEFRSNDFDNYSLFLDPLFWQALFPRQFADFLDEKINPNPQELWKYHWHRFIDFLAEGKSAEDSFKEILL